MRNFLAPGWAKVKSTVAQLVGIADSPHIAAISILTIFSAETSSIVTTDESPHSYVAPFGMMLVSF